MKGALITLKDKKTGRLFPCTTLEEGSCIFGLQPNSNYELTITAPSPKVGCSYGTEVRQVTTVGKIAPSTMSEQVTLEALCEGEIVEIPNIYYDLNKFNIRADAAAQLDNFVIPIMNKYPNMIVEIRSHTDCRASAAYNLKLSQNRANAAVAYLISRGISPSRMTAKGYGESVLKNGCSCEGVLTSTCTEEEHQKNRRTEFKILKLK
jgi:outer membrane protein OmpA-like peptidoglycan-associated protein